MPRVITPDQAPRSIKREAQRGDPTRLNAWIAEQEQRYATVATCDVCGREMVAEDLPGHPLKHASSGRVRALAGTILLYSDDELREAVALVATIR